MLKANVQKFGKSLSSMIMPNIGAFIAWGIITALFIEVGWLPNERLATMVGPMITYLLPLLIGITGGKMLGGPRGGVIAAVATTGVIAGSDVVMFIGAMMMGPFAGWVIKKFDDSVDGKIPAGFEMLVNNFSIGIIGVLLAVFGFYAIGPFIETLTGFLTVGVDMIMAMGLLPLTAIFIEPAKVLFLNNAMNHGIFSPIGAEQAMETGRSIMYMLEANPGPGLGVLAAYWAFAKGTIRDTAPGAIIIHFFGGIHEIYFPYILMKPVLIVAPIAGSMASIFFFTLTDAGLVGPASPGSIIAFLAMAPRGDAFTILIGVMIGAAVSFLVAAPIIKGMPEDSNLDEAKEKMKDMKSTTATQNSVQKTDIKKIIFACDAGMGSSAMGATKFRNRIKDLGLGIEVKNTSVDNVPSDADVVICQIILSERVQKSAPNSEHIFIENFLGDKNLDSLFERLQNKSKNTESASDTSTQVVSKEEPAVEKPSENNGILTEANILVGLPSVSKEEAIKKAGELLHSGGYVNEGYIGAMLRREELTTTYIGLNLAIPHGTSDAKDEVLKSGIVVLQYPEGIKFGDDIANLVIGIAGVGNEHLDILAKISISVEDEEVLQKLKTTTDKDFIFKTFS